MKQVKVFAGLTHQHVEKTVNRWIAENQEIRIENMFSSEWAGDSGRAFSITLYFENNPEENPQVFQQAPQYAVANNDIDANVKEKGQVKAAIPVRRRDP
jgi:hypothetical protein